MTLNSGPHIIGLNRRIEELEDELQLANQTIAELRRELGMVRAEELRLCALGFTSSEAKVVNALRKHDIVSREQIMLALYSAKPRKMGVMVPENATVHVSKARSKAKRFGANIHGIWGVGWRMDDAGKTAITRAMNI